MVYRTQNKLQEIIREENQKVIDLEFRVGDFELEEKRYSLVLYPDDQTIQYLGCIIEDLKKCDDKQCFFTDDLLHSTIISFTDKEGTMPDKMDRKLYEILKHFNFKFKSGNLVSNDEALALTYVCESFEPSLLRIKVRKIFNIYKNLYQSEFKENLFWSTLVRYNTPPSKSFLGYIRNYQPEYRECIFNRAVLIYGKSKILAKDRNEKIIVLNLS